MGHDQRQKARAGFGRGRRRPWTACVLVVVAGRALAAEVSDARCHVVPDGPEAAEAEMACAIRQDMGFVVIRRGDGVIHELRPAGDKPGLYMDQYGGSAYGSPLVDGNGFFFRFRDESVEVRWGE